MMYGLNKPRGWGVRASLATDNIFLYYKVGAGGKQQQEEEVGAGWLSSSPSSSSYRRQQPPPPSRSCRNAVLLFIIRPVY